MRLFEVIKIDLSRDEVNSIELSPSTSYRCFTPPIGNSNFDNAREFIEINLDKDNYFYQLHADGIVFLDLNFKTQFGNRLLQLFKDNQILVSVSSNHENVKFKLLREFHCL